MAEENLPKFRFYRTYQSTRHDTVKGNINTVKGNRGILLVNSLVYQTIEREIPRFVHIPIGTYTLKMEYSPTKTRNGVPRRQFRIMGHNVPSLERGGPAILLIHDGEYPGELEGCIAPGKMTISGGVARSVLAMEELFNACGGFQPKEKAAILEVVFKPIFQDPIGGYPTL